MCFYLALKFYILYSFFCATFSPPGRTGSGCLCACWAAGFSTELGKQHQLHTSLQHTWLVAVGESPASLHSPQPVHSDGVILGDIDGCWS